VKPNHPRNNIGEVGAVAASDKPVDVGPRNPRGMSSGLTPPPTIRTYQATTPGIPRGISPGLTSPIRNDEATNYLNSDFRPAGAPNLAKNSLQNSSESSLLEKDEVYHGHPEEDEVYHGYPEEHEVYHGHPEGTVQDNIGQEHTTGRRPKATERDERRDSNLREIHRWTDIVQGAGAEPRDPTAKVPLVVVPPPENEPLRKPKGILRPPREKFPEPPEPIREGVAPLKDAKKDGIPPDARWTKISRKLVNPEALELGKERFEAREDFVIVLRVLSKEEVQAYAEATQQIRGLSYPLIERTKC
jgi:hypothetical protein